MTPSSPPSTNMNDSAIDSNTHLRVTVEDAPPPYSETDIYSASSTGHRSPRLGGPAQTDDAVSRISSSSTGDAIIYTPPLTPRSCTNAQPFSIPASPSANLYFDDRPAPQSANSRLSDPVVHKVSIQPSSKPDDLPYPAEWAAARDVTQQDWSTFVNFLIPYHDAEVNEAILAEKVRSDDLPEIMGEKSSAEGSLRSGRDEERERHDADEAARRRAEIEATVQQWNDGFFSPRGVHVQLDSAEEQPHIPGAWDTSFDQASSNPGTADAGPSTQRGVPAATAATAGPSSHQQPVGGWRGGFGGLRIDNDGVRWGDRFVADSKGVRIGNLVVDDNGIRMNGHGVRRHGNQTWGGPSVGHYNAPGGSPWSPDRGRSAMPHTGGAHPRSDSVSSSSSSSSSDSSNSDASSIGSLPEYDDLRDSQMPLFIERLKSWTSNPTKVRTKADVKQFRDEIKAMKNNSAPIFNEMDRAQLRAQIKGLKQQWRAMRKQQQKERKAVRKERRTRRKEERKEKRQRRKEMKKAKKEAHRGPHAPPPPPGPAPIPAPHVHIPPIPPVPPVPQVPQGFPPFGGRGWGSGHGWGWGWGEARGRGGCRNNSGPAGFFGAHGPSIPSLDRGNHNGPFGPGNCFNPRGGFGPQDARAQRGWGRNRGRAGHFPGSWPEDRQGEDARGEDDELPQPGPVSAEKYRTVDGLETEIRAKEANLAEVSADERRSVEMELDALVEKLDHLRTEADEAYARELQEGEGQYRPGHGY